MDWEKIAGKLISDGQMLDVRLVCGWHNKMQNNCLIDISYQSIAVCQKES